jgi:hypothetical protein
MYADQDWRAYSTGITADAEGVKGSVLDCGVNGICHAAYTGSAHINACTSNGPEHFYYHDTFGSGEMSLTDCTAVGAETLFKTISAGGLRGAIIKECRIYPMVQEAAVYLVYLVNASNVEIRDCQMILDGPGPAGFLGADISTCRDIRLLGNVLAADVASAVVQAPDTFAGISGWRSIGNRLRLPTGLQALYTDTM